MMLIKATLFVVVSVSIATAYDSSYGRTLYDKYGHPIPWNNGGGKTPGCNGDPHFTGADSSHFDFSGVPNTTYCLLTDSHVHINAFFGGYYGKYEGRNDKSISWMREIGLLWGHHTILLRARSGPQSEYLDGYMASIEIDGQAVRFSSPGDSAEFGAEKEGSVTWLSAKEANRDELIDTYAVDIKGVISVILELRPELPSFRTETDGTVHFDAYMPFSNLSNNVHGILGQTFRADHSKRLSSMKLEYNEALKLYVVPGDNGDGFLDGSVEDYRASSILAPDCKLNRFVKLSNADSETSLAVEMSSGGVPSVLSASAYSSPMAASSATYKRLRRMRLMKKLRLL